MSGEEWKSKAIIYADVREERSGIPDILKSSGVMVALKQLTVGDYLISGEVVVERKSAHDFARSLFDGRLFDQARRLTESYPVAVYIVEGDPLRLYRYQDKVKQLTAALVALIIDFNVRVVYSEGPWHTAMIIESLAKRSLQGGRSVTIHKKPKLESTREWQLYIVESFPGIGPKTAERILETFGSIERFVNASIVELSKVPGLGEKKAETIKRILKSPYKPGGGRRGGSLEDYVGGERGE